MMQVVWISMLTMGSSIWHYPACSASSGSRREAPIPSDQCALPNMLTDARYEVDVKPVGCSLRSSRKSFSGRFAPHWRPLGALKTHLGHVSPTATSWQSPGWPGRTS